MERRFTHKVVGAGLPDYYKETATGKFIGTEAECNAWVAKQEHPEFWEVTYSTVEFSRREICRRLFGEPEPELSEREEIALTNALNMKDSYEARLGKDAEAAANFVEDFVNNYSCPMKEFVDKMSRKHNTNQQSFTKLALLWIERVASDEYRYDGRNESAHRMCKRLLDNWLVKHPDDGIHMDTEMLKDNPPSKWMHMV